MKIVSFRTKPKKTRSAKTGTRTSAATRSRPASRGSAGTARRRKRRNARPLALGGILAVLVLLAIVVQQTIGASWLRSRDAGLQYVGDIPVHEDFLPEGYAARPGEKREIRYVVIHETDNENQGANAQAHNEYLHSYGREHELSWHYTVDDHEIWHHIPDDETAFHAGDHMEDGGGNKNGIGVEMCVNADGDYEQTLKNAQVLAAHLLHEYGLTIDDLKKHQDFSGKNCPSKLLGAGRWDEFVQGVQAQLDELEREDT